MFTPIETSIGAILLHQATSNLLFKNGSILGASSLLRGFFVSPTKAIVSFFAGMVLSYVPLRALLPELLPEYSTIPLSIPSLLTTIGIGALIGWGTKAASGCTSGHMLCGLSRLSGRSLVATMIFFPSALITNHLVHPTIDIDVCVPEVPCYEPSYPSNATTFTLLFLAASVIVASRLVPEMIADINARGHQGDVDSTPRLATQFFTGLEFGLGLHISGMSQPAKLLSFFAFPDLETWDPSLLLVLVFGVLPNLIEIQSKGFHKPPQFSNGFELPQKSAKDIDWRFIIGAAAFGIGWGLGGTCPGPAVLRAVAQPIWGLVWMSGFWIGGKVFQ